MQKDIIMLGVFSFLLIGGIVQAVRGESLYSSGFGVFAAGWSAAILLGSAIKYFSQTERDMRDMRQERERLKKKPPTIRRTKRSGTKVAAK
jgi:hypothetical protein